MDTLVPLTKEIIEQYDWQEMIAECAEKERFRYCSLFCAKAEAHEAGDRTAQEDLNFHARAEGVDVDTIINRLMKVVPEK